jgi:hypothetical protein
MFESNDGFDIVGIDQLDDQDDGENLAPPARGDVNILTQELHLDEGDFEPGADVVGWAHGTVIATGHGRAICHITFRFEEEHSIVAHGILPAEGRSIGSGYLAVTGGTGQFQGATGTMRVQTRNPKRWSFEP